MLPITSFQRRLTLNTHRIYDDMRLSLPHPLRMAVKAGIAAAWAASHLHPNGVELPYLEIMVTRRCTLRCKHCSNLINLFKSPKDVPIGDILSDLDKILAAVDRIHLVKILGGEPFLYKPLGELVQQLQRSKKVGKIEIVTNGTLVPSDQMAKSLSGDKISALISPYGALTARASDALEQKLNAFSVAHTTAPVDIWTDFGGFEPRNRTESENRAMFAKCPTCVTLIDGRIFVCPRAGNGVALGLVPDVKGESVRIRESEPKAIRQALIAFSRLEAVSTCDRCDFPGPEIPIAEQE